MNAQLTRPTLEIDAEAFWRAVDTAEDMADAQDVVFRDFIGEGNGVSRFFSDEWVDHVYSHAWSIADLKSLEPVYQRDFLREASLPIKFV